ncbi:MAG: hypothetical protein ACXABG_11710 [Promethearchaeota archaeon]|jgi:hypothetical protein
MAKRKSKPDELDTGSSLHSFMHDQSYIIVGLYTYLQEFNNKDIEALFSNAIDLFNALGSWIYGETSPKIIYPELQIFIKKANNCSAENFSDLLDYINCAGNKIYKIIEYNQWIEDHYYESFTIRKSNEVTTGLFFMWRLGWLIVRLKDSSKGKMSENVLLLFKILENLFNAIGGWIYNQDGVTNIAQINKEFEKLHDIKLDMDYTEILEEAMKTRENIAKFLEKF